MLKYDSLRMYIKGMEFENNILKPMKACILMLLLFFGFMFVSCSLSSLFWVLLNVYMYNASTSVVNKGIDNSSNYDKLELITFVFFGLEVFLSVILFIVGFSSNVDEMFIVIGMVAFLVSLYGLFHSISLRMDYNCHKPIR